MALYPIFPVSPVPANLNRDFNWNTNKVKYDSGARQGLTPFSRPLYRYQLGFQNILAAKRDQIVSLVNSVQGATGTFWFPDPYDYVNSVMVVRSGITNAATVQVFDTNSFLLQPASLQVQTLASATSGFVTNGAEFSYNMESGWMTVNTKATADVWGARSLNVLFKKCSFEKDYSDASQLWGVWGAALTFEEHL